MKTAIVYASVHHGNTLKVLNAIKREYPVDLIDATTVKERDLTEYDWIGFASGIYYSKFHQSVLDFAKANLPEGKKTFCICTYGGKDVFKTINAITQEKKSTSIGSFSCKGYDSFGPFKLVGGVCKGHPNEEDLEDAVAFYKNMLKMYE